MFFLHSYCMHIQNNMYIYLDLFKLKIRSPSTRAYYIMLWSDSHKMAAKSDAFSLTCSPGFLALSRYRSPPCPYNPLVSSLVLELAFHYLLCCFSQVNKHSTCCIVTKSCLTLWDPIDCSMPRFSVLHYLPEFAQTHVH